MSNRVSKQDEFPFKTDPRLIKILERYKNTDLSKEKKSNGGPTLEYINFAQQFELDVFNFDNFNVNLERVPSSFFNDFNTCASFLAAKYFQKPAAFFHLQDIRIVALLNLLKTKGKLSVINYAANNSESIGYHSTFMLETSDNPDDSILLSCMEFDDESTNDYPDYADELINEKIWVVETLRLYFHQGNENIISLMKEINDLCKIKLHDHQVYVDMIIQNVNGLSTQRVPFNFQYQSDDLELHYGDGFQTFNDKLINRLKNSSKGIVMLHGPPGNGKTHYVRRLLPDLCSLNKRVVLIPKYVLSALENPGFNQFMLQHFAGQEIVFVIEDAESIIANNSKDGSGRSGLVSTLLNITDGILNDVFNIQVLLTFNTSLKEIDKALLRKGRLIAKYEFKNLTFNQAEKLAAHLGLTLSEKKEEYSLAEIYALKEIEEDEVLINQSIDKITKKGLGFN